MEKNWVKIGSRVVERLESGMTYQDVRDSAERSAMDEMRWSMAAPLLFPLFYFFDTKKRPLSPIEFWDFWMSLTLDEQRPFLLFSRDELKPTKEK